MTSGPQLAMTGKREEWLLQTRMKSGLSTGAPRRHWAVPKPWPVMVGVRQLKAGPVVGVGWPAGTGARPAGLESVRGLWSQAGLSSRAKRGFSILA